MEAARERAGGLPPGKATKGSRWAVGVGLQTFESGRTAPAVGALAANHPTERGEIARQRALRAGQSVRRGIDSAGPVPVLRLEDTSTAITLSGRQRPGGRTPPPRTRPRRRPPPPRAQAERTAR